MQLFNLALCWLFFGFLAAHLARKRQKNPKIWFWIGLTLGIFGILLLYLTPNRPLQASAAIAPQKPVVCPEHPPEPLLLPFESQWYYYDEKKERQGPLPPSGMGELQANGQLHEDTFVWTSGMEGWLRIKNLPAELKKW